MSESKTNNIPDKPEILAALKLVSGEEVLAMVEYVRDENGDYLIETTLFK